MNITFFCPQADTRLLGEKLLLLYYQMKNAGHIVTVLCWDVDTAAMCAKHNVPCTVASLTYQPPDIAAEMAKFLDLLDLPAWDGTHAPSLAECLGYDDFPGSALMWQVDGTAQLMTDLLVCPSAGPENSTPQDSYLHMLLWRWSEQQQIPRLVIETQPLDSPWQLCHWPSAISPLRRRQQATTTRYLTQFGQDTLLDEVCRQEHALRTNLQNAPDTRFLYVPFSLQFKQHTIELLARLAPLAPSLIDAGWKLLLSASDKNFRKLIPELDMVSVGLRPWLMAWKDGHHAICSGIAPYLLVGIADCVLAPAQTYLATLAEQWGVPTRTHDAEWPLARLPRRYTLAQYLDLLRKDTHD